jgi:hypothetical protein
VRVHRGEGVAEASASLQARAFTHEGEIYLPASQGPLGSPATRSLLYHELTHVAQQRLLGPSLPAEDGSRGRELEAQAVAAETDGRPPLVLAPATSSPTARRGGGSVTAAAPVSRLAAATRGTPDGTDGAAVGPLPIPVQRADAAAPASPAPPGAPAPSRERRSEQELEELARQLYGRLRSRLRQELLTDRERAGLVTGR